MGRHFAVFTAAVAVLASSCGLLPADEPLDGADGECPAVDRPAPVELEVGVIMEFDDFGAGHVLCEVEYASSPPTSGDHFPTWQNCGFYTEPVRDETAVHSLEHGAIWIAYDPELDALTQDEIATVVGLDDHYLASPYPGLANPIVLTAWQRQLAVESMSDPAVAEFIDRQLGRVSETAPEAGVSCGNAVGAPPFDPDRSYDDAFAFFSES
ncbi:MAG: DUF3105 domain-containing protein [Actinomycetota bacterium]